MRSPFHQRRLIPSLVTLWLVMISACFPKMDQKLTEGQDAEAEPTIVGLQTQTKKASANPNREKVSVDVGVFSGSKNSASVMSLVSIFDAVDYQLAGCASGKTEVVSAGSASSLSLYKFDQQCTIGINRLRITGIDYTMPSGVTFDTGLNAVSSMLGTNGKTIYVKVQSQLPNVLTSANYAVGFIVSETIAGTDVAIPIYEVGITVDRSSITEGSGLTATFTLRRAVPAIGALTVNLITSGTAIPGTDTSAIPSSVSFANGQSAVTFTVSVTDDSMGESNETLTLAVGDGLYFPLDPPATFTIVDNDFAVLSMNPSTLSFGSQALNFPQLLPVTVTNSGQASATLFQLVSGLNAPFYFAGGYPGEGGTCGSTLAAGQTCTLVFGFNPTGLVSSSNTLSFSYFNNLASSSVSLTIQGTGANAAFLTLNTGARFDFGAQLTNTTSKKFVIVKNLGSGQATALSASFSAAQFSFAGGSFPGTGGNCSTSLASAASCTLVIDYSPTAVGAYSGTFTLNYNNGTQVLNSKTLLEGSSSNLIASSEVLTTKLNTALALTLTSSGGSGAVNYTIVQAPIYGTLSGTAPNITYSPTTGMSGTDTFTFRATDAVGPSAAAEIQIVVQPQAVFLVNNPASMVTMDTRVQTELQNLGFVVTLVDDSASSTAQASGKDLVAVSASVTPSSILTKYRDVRLPTVIWEKGLYDDMKIVSAASQAGNATSSTNINIVNNSHPITQGLSLGSQAVLLGKGKMPYVLNTDANFTKLATSNNNTNQTVLGGYEADAWMPGLMAAPARRLASFFPSSNGDFTATGLTLIQSSIKWLMQNKNNLIYDSFQRDASSQLGSGWTEMESNATALSLNGQQLSFQTDDSFSLATQRFELQNSGTMTMRYTMNLVRTGSVGVDYTLAMQLGRCDLMDRSVSNESGVAVNVLWGGIAAGMAAETNLGYRASNGLTMTLGSINTANANISIEVDHTSKTYKITSPLGTSAAIAFQNNVAIDCVRVLSRNINSNSFSQTGLHHLRIFQGN